MRALTIIRLRAAALSLTGLCIFAGCKSQPDPSSSYPVTPPGVKAATTADSSAAANPLAAAPDASKAAPIKVPADAQDLSHGDYPPPAFPEPSQPGSILVVDLDGDPTVAVASTSVTGKDGGKMMSITDVANMSITMNKLHKYRIVFVPTVP